MDFKSLVEEYNELYKDLTSLRGRANYKNHPMKNEEVEITSTI